MSKAEALKEELERRLRQSAFRKYRPLGHPDTLCPDGSLYKSMNWQTWTNKPWQRDFHEMGARCKERAIIAANGAGKCATSRTLVQTEFGPLPMGLIWGRDIRVRTWPSGELKRVVQWFRKKPESCYRITTMSGWIECPAEHRILTEHGWLSTRDVLLLRSDVVLPRKYWVSDRIVLPASVRHWWRKLRDYPGDCFEDFRLGDARLLSASNISPISSPLSSDVQVRSVFSSHKDDRAHKHTNILLQSCVRRAKNAYGVPPGEARSIASTGPAPCNDARWYLGYIRDVARFLRGLEFAFRRVLAVALRRFRSFSLDSITIDTNDIVSIRPVGRKLLYDMEVEDRHNYLAGGLVNHNSYPVAWETACHLLGDYPPWWEGYRFDRPVKWWIAAIDADQQREGIQNHLLGRDLDKNLGTGFIPGDRISGKVRVRQAGISEVADRVVVKHSSGGYSVAGFKTYRQGWRSFQAAAPDGITLDEEPDERDAIQANIFTECQTRIFRSSGILMAALTPLIGETNLTRHFMYPKHPAIGLVTATWDDAPHLAHEEQERMKATYPDHEIQTRVMGVPMMGEGRVFDAPEEDIRIRPFEIPPHFARIAGIDFGIDAKHPTAGGWLGWDRHNDIVYLYGTYRKAGELALVHAEAFKRRGAWIPVSWPHDGHIRDKGFGVQVKDHYVNHGLNMLPMSARYEKDRGGRQDPEPVIMDLKERMKTGRFFAFDTCQEFFEEYRSYHRKDGRLVEIRNDVLKAVMYGMMMLRYAYTEPASMRGGEPTGISTLHVNV